MVLVLFLLLLPKEMILYKQDVSSSNIHTTYKTHTKHIDFKGKGTGQLGISKKVNVCFTLNAQDFLNH